MQTREHETAQVLTPLSSKPSWELSLELNDVLNLAYAPYNPETHLLHPQGPRSNRYLAELWGDFDPLRTTRLLRLHEWAAKWFPNPLYDFSGLRAMIFVHRKTGVRFVCIAGTHKPIDWINDVMLGFGCTTPQEVALRHFVARFAEDAPLVFVGHSLGGYLAMRGAILFDAKYLTINSAHGIFPMNMGEAQGLHILTELDSTLAGRCRRYLPGDKYVVPGTGDTHTPLHFRKIPGLVALRENAPPSVVLPTQKPTGDNGGE